MLTMGKCLICINLTTGKSAWNSNTTTAITPTIITITTPILTTTSTTTTETASSDGVIPVKGDSVSIFNYTFPRRRRRRHSLATWIWNYPLCPSIWSWNGINIWYTLGHRVLGHSSSASAAGSSWHWCQIPISAQQCFEDVRL